MSEYIEIDSEMSDDSSQMYFYTNLKLTDGGVEIYETTAEMEEGSPVAQALAVVYGIAKLQLDGTEIILTRQPDADWHAIVDDVSAALKDFFL